jgi:serine protease Do
MMTLKSLRLLFVSLLLVSGASSVSAQQTAPATPRAPEAPGAFTIFIEGGSFLGIYTEDINKETMASYGLLREPRGVGVKRVVGSSPAEQAGLREHDVVIRFNNEPVTSVRKLNRLISEVAPEHTARLTILRGGDEKDLTVTLGKRSDFNTAYGVPGQRLQDLDKWNDFKFEDKFKFDDKNRNFSFVIGNNRRIGVATTQLTKQLANYFGISSGKGLLITSVSDGSPADKAGLRAGDVITEVDGSAVETVADLMRAISRREEGELSLTITRDKSQRNIRLTPERGKDSNLLTPGVYFAPQAMELSLPDVVQLPQLPKVTLPVMQSFQLPVMPKIVLPKIVLPEIRVITPMKRLTIPDAPL